MNKEIMINDLETIISNASKIIEILRTDDSNRAKIHLYTARVHRISHYLMEE